MPDKMEALVKLPGIGRKSANIILYNTSGKNEGIAVDTHVARVSQRLGLTKENKPENKERELMELVPRELWGKFSNLLIHLGRYICTAQKPKHFECPLYDLCPSRDVETQKEEIFSERLTCPDHGFSIPELSPRQFSFTSPYGACQACKGLGVKWEVEVKLLIDEKRACHRCRKDNRFFLF